MKILAIETSTRNSSLALADDSAILAEYRAGIELNASQDLVSDIDRILKKVGCALEDIDAFAVSVGPGSFTGLRVGVSVAKGFNLATGIPIIAVPTLDAIAENVKGSNDKICVAVDARKKMVYTSLYETANGGIIRKSDYALIAPEELIDKIDDSVLFVGDALAKYKELLMGAKGAKMADEGLWFPDAKVVARIGMEKFMKKEFAEPDSLVPMYIYSEECNVKGVYK